MLADKVVDELGIRDYNRILIDELVENDPGYKEAVTTILYRFGFEPEITAKIAKKKLRIFEVGIKYYGRTYDEGKKINWKDGFEAIYCIVKYNLFK